MMNRRREGKTALIATLAIGAVATLGAGLLAARLQALIELPHLGSSSDGGMHAPSHDNPPPELASALRADEPSATERTGHPPLGSGQSSTSSAPRREPRAVASCPSSLRLVGSVVNEKRPESSLAAIDVGSGTQLVRPGSIIGSYRLLALRPRRAYLRAPDAAVCELHGVAARASAGAASSAVQVVARTAASLSEADLKKGITQLDPHTFTVSRKLLNQALSDAKLLRRSAKVRVQSEENGVAGGLALTRLPKASPLRALGLKRGDVLRTINGHELSKPAGLVAGMNALQQGERVALVVARGGASETLTYIPN